MRLALAVAVVATTAPELADAHPDVVLGYPGIPDLAGPLPDDRLRFELGASVHGGSFAAGALHGGAGGGSLRGGLRYRRLAVLAEVGAAELSLAPAPPFVASITRPIAPPAQPTSGVQRDVVLAARYSLIQARSLATSRRRGPYTHIARDDLWLEAGIGRERVAWPAATPLDRPELVLGIGAETSTRDDSDGHRHAGCYVGVRLVLARDPTGGGVDHAIVGAMGFALGN